MVWLQCTLSARGPAVGVQSFRTYMEEARGQKVPGHSKFRGVDPLAAGSLAGRHIRYAVEAKAIPWEEAVKASRIFPTLTFTLDYENPAGDAWGFFIFNDGELVEGHNEAPEEAESAGCGAGCCE